MNKPLLNIILTDDDEDDRMFFCEALEEVEIQTAVKLFNNGEELMDYLLSPEIEFPNLIFLDLNMPKKSGMQCLCEIRSNPKLKNLFIAIYSTSSSEKDIEDAFLKGANIYVNKPNSFGKLRDMVKKVLHLDLETHNSNLKKETFIFRN
ncbi:response regulator [Mariniflexile ostreae]|uniref:Response regulator n=1 Tax=Mariniflexile ostreae TaxID=1520892 RepID=A0ABV5F8Q1_9FLAO